MDEAEERLGRAYAARYRHDLDALLSDLPAPAGVAPTRTGWPQVLAGFRAQVAADLAALRGRPEYRLRAVVMILVALLTLGGRRRGAGPRCRRPRPLAGPPGALRATGVGLSPSPTDRMPISSADAHSCGNAFR